MTIALVNAHIVVGDGTDIDSGAVILDGDLIADVMSDGTRANADVVIDLEGRTLIPGMMDLHTHLIGGDNAIAHGDESIGFRTAEPISDSVLAAVEAAAVTLNAGITTCREAAARDYIDVALRDFQRRGQIVAPRILASGPGISMTGGHGAFFDPENTADGVDAVIARVRQLVSHGVDWVKVVSTDGPETDGKWWTVQSTFEEVAAAFAEARRLGRRTLAHAMGAQGIENAVRAGVNTVEHGRYLTEENCVLMLEHGTFLSPTTGNVVMMGEYGARLGMPWAANAKLDGDRVYERHAMAVQMGVPIAMGSDCGGNEARVHGSNALELQCYVRYGMSAMEAIASATSVAARALGIEGIVGSISPGKRADLVLIDGDPLGDIALTSTGVVGVVQDAQVRRDDLGILAPMRLLTPARTRTSRSAIAD